MTARIPSAALAVLAALAVAPASSLAAPLANAPAPPSVELPGDAHAASLRADPATWIVGVRRGGEAIARAHGATRIAGGAWLAPRARTRALAAALRSHRLLDYAEPNRLSRRAQSPPSDPLSFPDDWRHFVVGDAVPPPVGPDSPLIGVVDTLIDVNHPDIAGSNISTLGGTRLRDLHGTATTTVAAAPANGVGIVGVWPGARALNLPLRDGQRISCAESTRAIGRGVRAGAAVINMSYSALAPCIAEEQQILSAVKAGAVPVAAAGNDGERGNPLEFPASLAHVITVSAVGPDLRATGFSNSNGAVDLSAPGEAILAAVPAAFDPDKTDDGFAFVDGTSFASPMVAAAIAWIRAARPELTPYQAAQVVRLGAQDVGRRGYENSTGFGILSLPGALARQPPAEDPQEPNDDVRYVNGRAFGSANPPLSSGDPASIAATTDYAEDPVDVYRVKIPAGQRARLSLVPTIGNPDLFVFRSGSRSVYERRALLRSSTRRGDATERLSFGNPGRGTRTIYVAVGFKSGKPPRLFNAGYVLRVR